MSKVTAARNQPGCMLVSLENLCELLNAGHVLPPKGTAAAEEKLGFLERSPTAWRPMMWPIKLLMCAAVLLMLLQGIAILIRDIATIRGEEI